MNVLRPRWRKVVRDLATRPSRTLLVVLSIAVGVFGLGAIAGARAVLARELAAGFASIRPASVTITTDRPFGNDLIEAVRRMPEVGEVEGRRSLLIQVEVAMGEWRDLQLNVIPDFDAMRLDIVRPAEGDWPPPEHELLLERTSLAFLGVDIGDSLTLRLPDGRRRTMRVAGSSHDLYALIYVLDGTGWGHITFETLRWLGQDQDLNELRARPTTGADDRAHVNAFAAALRERLERSGLSVYFMQVPDPGEHPLDATIQTILLVLGAVSVLSLALSGLLVTNTIAALLGQEIRQIGIMKAIGARSGQIVRLYAGLVLAYGLLSAVVALPLGLLGTRFLVDLVAGYLNFDIANPWPPPAILILQAVVALAVPLVAALPPILAGTRVSVRRALSEYGLGQGRFGRGRLEQRLERVMERSAALRRAVPRPLLLSLRNTFRRKGRLALTLATLTTAGAMFVAVFSVRDSLDLTLDELLDLWQYDLWVMLEQPERASRLTHEALQVPGVVAAEGWGFASARVVTEAGDGAADIESSSFGFVVPTIVFAPPADTKLLAPVLLRGRWLLPEDERAIVINTTLQDDQPGLDVGGELTLRLFGRDSRWTVVGIAQAAIPSPMAYVAYAPYTRAVHDTDRASALMVVTEEHDLAGQTRVSALLEERLQRAGVRVSAALEIARERQEAAAAFQAIVVLLLMVAGLLAVVGGIGLSGTMSLNVIERTREIGVLRAVGAGTGAVLQIVVVEGLIIGLLSWLLGLVASVPLAWAIDAAVGTALFQSPLSFAFSPVGALGWLLVVSLLAVLASLAPALAAARMSVRETLAYA